MAHSNETYPNRFDFPYPVLMICGPSGVGKSTLVGSINKIVDIYEPSISHTTRLPNLDQETPGKSYYFITREEFLAKMNAGEFAETNPYMKGSLYGTAWSEFGRIGGLNKVPAFDIDINGVIQLDKLIPRSKTCRLYLDVSEDEQRYRLEKRGRDNQEAIEKRIKYAKEEKQQLLEIIKTDPTMFQVIDYNNFDPNLFAHQLINHLVYQSEIVGS